MRAAWVMLVVACAKPQSKPAAPAMTVGVDRRVELVALVERLAGAPEYAQPANTAYTQDLAEFDKVAAHPAVVLARELHAKGIAYEQPMFFAIHLDDPHRAAALRAIDPRWNAIDVDGFAAAIAQFDRDANFDAFWTAHHAYEHQVEQRFSDAIVREQPAPWFADLFGPTKLPFVVVPALGNGPQNYGVRSTAAFYQIMGVGAPDPDGLPIMDDAMRELIVHEMAHSFVNPVIERHLAELQPAAAPLFALVAPQMRAQAYGDVKIMLFESCVRALTTLYARDRRGAGAGADAARREAHHGFVWTAGLADELAKFRAGGTHDLDAFVPELVRFFTATSAKYAHGIPFDGPIDGAITGGDLAIIYTPELADYVAQLQQHVLPHAAIKLVVPDDKLEAMPPGELMVYGTPASNPLVAAVVKRAGWKLADGDLELGSRHFTGPGLVLIACWPRAEDPTHGVVVYAGTRDADLVGVNTVRAGGTDWVVARRLPNNTFGLVASGDFPRAVDGSWQLP